MNQAHSQSPFRIFAVVSWGYDNEDGTVSAETPSNVSVQDLLKQSQDSHSVLQTVAQTQTTLAKKVGANLTRAAF